MYNDIVTDWSGNPLIEGELDPSFDQMMGDIKNDVPFAFSRWGDGEWMAVLDIKKQHQSNADGALYYDSLRERLREILLLKPWYKLGLQNFAWRNLAQIENFLQENDLIKLNWVTSDALHRANMKRPEKMEEFFEILRSKEVVLVGPEFLGKVDKFKFKHIVIPEREAWLYRGHAFLGFTAALKYHQICLFASGMTSNVLISEASVYASVGVDNMFQNKQLLDIGSLLDPYAGVNSRTYHKDVIARL